MSIRPSRREALGLIAAAFVPGGALGQTLAPYDETPIDVASARRKLAGTLALPLSGSRWPVVLIIAGSGPTDREGNNPLGVSSDTYKKLARALAARGIASVRYDKRYVGASNVPPVDESRLRFEDEVDDAAAWIRLLSRDRRFGGVTIAGHSQGSLTGMLAAERIAPAAFVSLEGPGRDGGTVILDQIGARYPPELQAKAREIVMRLDDGETAVDVPPALNTLFRPSVQLYLMTWFPYDPAREIAQLRCPITIVQGTDDTQVSLDDAKALKAAAPSAKLIVVPRMTHTLKLVGPDVEQIRTYLDPALPVASEAIDAVAAATR